MSEENGTWGDYSKLVLKELERLNENYDRMRTDMDSRFSELNQKLTEVKNIEGNPFHGLCEIAHRVRPHQCTLVPDEESAATSDHGWNLARDGTRLRPLIQELKDLGIRVSLFIDPDAEAMRVARELGADRIELYTEPYARAFDAGDPKASLDLYSRAARSATDSGLGLNAGHDLNQANLPVFLAAVPGILEVSIGHALIADALEAGFAQTVRNYLSAIARGAAT